jgi:hypothetical protein
MKYILILCLVVVLQRLGEIAKVSIDLISGPRLESEMTTRPKSVVLHTLDCEQSSTYGICSFLDF